MTTKSISTMACAPGALGGGPVRTRFFDGMFLTAADLEAEQRYWRLKRRLTNRALGAGVVWGLRLIWVKERRVFQLTPGYALDCCGNDLIVECPIEISERELWSRADPSLTGGFEKNAMDACVLLQYTECPEEPRTVQGDACSGPTGACELSRVRETVRVLLAPPPTHRETPPERFLDQLDALKANLSSDIAAKVLPPSPPPPPAVSSGTAPPVTLLVGLPGVVGTIDTIPFPVAGSSAATGGTMSGPLTQSTAVVTFTLDASSGWSFTGGSVTDQGRAVETVTPPSAPSMYWSLDIAVPGQVQGTQTVKFDFLVESLVVAQVGGASGTVNAEISGTVELQNVGTAPAGGQQVALKSVTVLVKEATIGGTAPSSDGCLDSLVWAWTVDPENGSKIARVLVLAALYAFLEEIAQLYPSSSAALTKFYSIVWFGAFQIDPSQDPSGQTLASLSKLIQDLFQAWCDNFAYPGPRCHDEHHGVYLGCGQINTSGAWASFDMRANRRYVLTGPLLSHWAGQFGVAPLDVVAGRLADAFCCIAAQAPLGVASASTGFQGYGAGIVHTGTTYTVQQWAQKNEAQVTYTTTTDLMKRSAEAFSQSSGGAKQVIATQIDGGAVIALLVPAKGDATVAPVATLGADVTAQLKAAGDSHVMQRARPLVTRFVTGVLASAPASSLLGDGAPAASLKLAKLLDAKGVTIADLAAGGTAVALAKAGATSDPTLAASADDLVDKAELAVGSVTTATVKALGSSPDPAAFADATKQAALAKALAGAVPKLPVAAVTAGANAAKLP